MAVADRHNMCAMSSYEPSGKFDSLVHSGPRREHASMAVSTTFATCSAMRPPPRRPKFVEIRAP